MQSCSFFLKKISTHKLLRVSPAPVLVAAPAGALPNASEGKRLRPVAYESCKNGFACEEVQQVEKKKQLRLLQTFLQEPELS